MLYYIFPFIYSVVIFFMFNKYKIENKAMFLSICLLPYILVEALRGKVGTDYVTYEIFFHYTLTGDINAVVYERGFLFLTQTILFFTKNEHWTIIIVGLITSGVFIYTFSKSRQKLAVFILLIAPLFLFDMIMNGLRYGLSFAIACLAISELYKVKQNVVRFMFFSVLAISVQYSSLIILLIFFLFKIKLNYKQSLVLVLVLFLFFASINFDLTYFLDKKNSYSEAATPSGLSGIGPFVIFLMLFFYMFFYVKMKNKMLLILLLCEILSFYLSSLTYAGLRFLNLFLFAIILCLAFENFDKIKKTLLFLFLIGCIGLTLKTKNFIDEENQNETPFLPYKFYFEDAI